MYTKEYFETQEKLNKQRKLWKISYIPATIKAQEIEWVYKGTEAELDQYLNTNHSCKCEDCKDVEFYESAQSCEYHIEELKDLSANDIDNELNLLCHEVYTNQTGIELPAEFNFHQAILPVFTNVLDAVKLVYDYKN